MCSKWLLWCSGWLLFCFLPVWKRDGERRVSRCGSFARLTPQHSTIIITAWFSFNLHLTHIWGQQHLHPESQLLYTHTHTHKLLKMLTKTIMNINDNHSQINDTASSNWIITSQVNSKCTQKLSFFVIMIFRDQKNKRKPHYYSCIVTWACAMSVYCTHTHLHTHSHRDARRRETFSDSNRREKQKMHFILVDVKKKVFHLYNVLLTTHKSTVEDKPAHTHYTNSV